MRFDKASALSHERILCKVRPSYQGTEEAKAEQPDFMFPCSVRRQETVQRYFPDRPGRAWAEGPAAADRASSKNSAVSCPNTHGPGTAAPQGPRGGHRSELSLR